MIAIITIGLEIPNIDCQLSDIRNTHVVIDIVITRVLDNRQAVKHNYVIVIGI